MISFSKHVLENGLTLIVHEDHSTPMCVVNTLYNVGSRDEDPNKTGFAHLFEHLMFGGTKNVKNFDEELQRVGGDNNAFTSPDITNYYSSAPAQNLETALWLESDRMLQLSFDPHVLEVQRKVVIEEFKQRYLNQPYGDVWLHLRPLAYTQHSYQWATIGKDISHIQDATMDDVERFFYSHYAPNNAILVIAGNVSEEKVVDLVKKYYGDVPSRKVAGRDIPKEPPQQIKRSLSVQKDVPADALYMSFHSPSREDREYHTVDLLSDILGRGQSSRLYQKLVKEESIFSSINAHVSGSHDPGLFTISGRLYDNIEIEVAENAVWNQINAIKNQIDEDDVEKVKNQAEASLIYGEMEILNKAINLATHTVLGNTDNVNKELNYIRNVNAAMLKKGAQDVLQETNCSVLHYLSAN